MTIEDLELANRKAILDAWYQEWLAEKEAQEEYRLWKIEQLTNEKPVEPLEELDADEDTYELMEIDPDADFSVYTELDI